LTTQQVRQHLTDYVKLDELQKLSTVHQMMFPPTASQGDGQRVLVKGELECIDISTAKRSGKKKSIVSQAFLILILTNVI